jgi:hypothetical protein
MLQDISAAIIIGTKESRVKAAEKIIYSFHRIRCTIK